MNREDGVSTNDHPRSLRSGSCDGQIDALNSASLAIAFRLRSLPRLLLDLLFSRTACDIGADQRPVLASKLVTMEPSSSSSPPV
jgi:hypothetical protein